MHEEVRTMLAVIERHLIANNKIFAIPTGKHHTCPDYGLGNADVATNDNGFANVG
jgi:hypothetical protein